MRKITKIISVLLLACLCLPTWAYATPESSKAEDIIFFEDGSYVTIEITCIETRATSTRTGNKTYTYHNSEGEEEWKAVLRGSFNYNGATAVCTSSTCTVTIYNTNWYTVSKSTSKSGPTAKANLTMGLRYVGVTIDEKSYTITLSCDPDGNLS